MREKFDAALREYLELQPPLICRKRVHLLQWFGPLQESNSCWSVSRYAKRLGLA